MSDLLYLMCAHSLDDETGTCMSRDALTLVLIENLIEIRICFMRCAVSLIIIVIRQRGKCFQH